MVEGMYCGYHNYVKIKKVSGKRVWWREDRGEANTLTMLQEDH